MSHAPELPELPIGRADSSAGGTSAGELPRFQNPDSNLPSVFLALEDVLTDVFGSRFSAIAR